MDNFNVENVVEQNVKYLRKFFDGFSKDSIAVIGISGGKDSTIAAGLLVKAIGNERVLGVMMPNGVQADIADSEKVCDFLGIRKTTINIAPIFEAAKATYKENSEVTITDQLITNLPPRIRMTTLYAVAQGQTSPAFVVNTCNRSEDYVGYSTKYGDAAGDIAVLQDLLVCEVLEVGDYIGMPEELVHKTPSDGLCGKTDEDNLGFTYKQLDSYIKWIDGGRKDSCPIDKDLADKIDRKHVANLHKLKTIPSFDRR